MGAVNPLSPPDGWMMDTGVWDTDATREDTLAQTGAHVLHLKSTAVATKIIGPWIPIRASTQFNNTYALWCLIRASAIGGGQNVTVKVQGYQSDRQTTTTSATAINASELAAANTWEWYGLDITFSSSTRWARFEISKAAVAFNLYVDHVSLEKYPPGLVVNGGSETLSSGAWQTINATSGAFETEILYSAAPDQVVIQVPGMYAMVGYAEVSGFADGEALEIAIVKNGATYYYGTMYPTGAAGTVRAQAIVYRGLDSGDTIELQLKQTSGNDRTIEESELSVVRIASNA